MSCPSICLSVTFRGGRRGGWTGRRGGRRGDRKEERSGEGDFTDGYDKSAWVDILFPSNAGPPSKYLIKITYQYNGLKLIDPELQSEHI